MPNFTVLIIATNKYVNFLPELLDSIEKKLFVDALGQILVFTNEPDAVSVENTGRIRVQTISIPGYGWPDATLRRYEVFKENWHLVEGELVIYVDVDALVVAETNLADLVRDMKKSNSQVFVVRHPGYYRRDLKTWIAARRNRGIWESDKRSKAYVPLTKRITYVAGGVWGGYKDALLRMIGNLASNVEDDLTRGLIAISHDESHLNSWITRNRVMKLSPAWVYAPGYKNLDGIEPIIEVLHKPVEYFDDRKPEILS